MWGFFVVCLVALALFFKVKVVYIALLTTSALYFGGGALLGRGFARLGIERSAGATRLFPGESGRVTIRFINGSLVPLAWLSAHDHLPERLARGKARRWVTSLAPLGQSEYTYEVSSSRRGVYTIGPIDLIAGDPLGLHQQRGASQNFHDVIIYPEILQLADLGLPSDLPVGNVTASAPIFQDPARIAGVREYAPGDSQQTVHWKATARTGRLQVKQHEHTVTLDAFLLLNLAADEYVTSHGSFIDDELPVTVAAALANHLARSGESFGFVTNAALVRHGASGPLPYEATVDVGTGSDDAGEHHRSSVVRLLPRKGYRQLMRVLEILAACEPRVEPAATTGDFADLVVTEARRFGWGATILLITPLASERLMETGMMLRRSGYRVVIFATAEARENVRQGPGPAVYRVRQERDRSIRIEPAGGGAAVDR